MILWNFDLLWKHFLGEDIKKERKKPFSHNCCAFFFFVLNGNNFQIGTATRAEERLVIV